MKNRVLQDLVLSKYQNGEGPSKIFHDLSSSVSLRTVERWCKMIKETGSIKLSCSPGRPRTARTKINIQKVKTRLKRKKRLSTRKLAKELDISRSSAQRTLTTDLRCRPYKKIIQPLLTEDHLAKRKKFANWVKSNFRKEKNNEDTIFR
jgi:transposase